ncbi:hypothetical protein BJ742DRAFT_270394 [Cladochytrium replicatum]|nr:hypothetical protein BJ742DRAFT_270394 [Cladochytrium replicatum]
MMRLIFIAIFLLSLSTTIYAHSAITAVKGANGCTGTALGINLKTPRSGSRRRPFQQDSARTRSGGCGDTLELGELDVPTELQKQLNLASCPGARVPTTDKNGNICVTVHQVNGDGAGPMRAQLATDVSGNEESFKEGPVDITQQMPGTNGRSRARATDFEVCMTIPKDTKCTGNVGKNKNVCMVRMQNPNRSKFGGCFPVKMGK